jgi:hypothetical protein
VLFFALFVLVVGLPCIDSCGEGSWDELMVRTRGKSDVATVVYEGRGLRGRGKVSVFYSSGLIETLFRAMGAASQAHIVLSYRLVSVAVGAFGVRILPVDSTQRNEGDQQRCCLAPVMFWLSF